MHCITTPAQLLKHHTTFRKDVLGTHTASCFSTSVHN